MGYGALEWTLGGTVLVIIIGLAALRGRRPRPARRRNSGRDGPDMWLTGSAGDRDRSPNTDNPRADAADDTGSDGGGDGGSGD